MSVNFSDFITYAEAVFAKGQHEIDWRNAASRAYYASWHATTAIDNALQSYRGMPTGGGIHAERIKKFSHYPQQTNPDGLDQETARQVRAVGYMLNQLRASRVRADYFIEEQYTRADAQTNIEAAKGLLQKTGELQKQLGLA